MVLAVTLTSGNPVAAGTGGLWLEDGGCLGVAGLSCREPVGDGADDDVGAGAQYGRQQQAPLVLQDPVAPVAWLDFGDQDGDLAVVLLCLPDVVDDRVDQ
jgi:hypothetical protein